MIKEISSDSINPIFQFVFITGLIANIVGLSTERERALCVKKLMMAFAILGAREVHEMHAWKSTQSTLKW